MRRIVFSSRLSLRKSSENKPMLLANREFQPELMDDAALDCIKLHQALRGLTRLNAVSRSVELIWREIAPLLKQSHVRPLRVLDIATGAGDIPRKLAKRAAANGFHLEIVGCDKNTHTLQFARERAIDEKVDVRFFELDVLSEELPQEFDVICCSLFIHHLLENDVRELLQKMQRAARKMIVISDLRRCFRGYVLALTATKLCSASSIVHIDGPRSVKNAFSPQELQQLCNKAGLRDVVIENRWPLRMVLVWRHNE